MKKFFLSLAAFVQAVMLFAQYQPDAPARASGANAPLESFASFRRVLFNFDWKFALGDVQGAADPSCDDTSWRSLDLPHDFQFEQPWLNDASLNGRGFKPMCEGWYRKTFRTDPSWEGKKVYLEFDGIMYYSDVYVNGVKVASSEYGYIGFETEITGVLKQGQDNVVAVYANSGKVNGSRWYTGAGIFRDVYLEVKNPTHIQHDGVYITTPSVTAAGASVALQVEVDGFKNHNASIKVRILDPDGRPVGETSAGFFELTKHTREEVALPPVQVPSPKLWSPDTPYLYTAEVEVWADGVLADKAVEPFGIRTLEFSKESGFKLNGQKVFLKGVADHHDLGALGAASYDRAIERLMLQLKAFGYNTIRCSHNPYSRSFTRIADRVGILVVDELIDKWSDDEYWGGRVPFTSIWYKLIPEWIKRDRNSPSVIMWSLGNELQQRERFAGFPTEDWGITTYRLFDVLVRRYDDTRKTTVAMHPSRAGGIREEKEFSTYLVPPELATVTDISSFNYQWMVYQDYLKHDPDMIVFQSEAQSRELLGPFYGMDQEKMVGMAYWGAVEYWGESDGWPKKGWNYSYFNHTLEPYPQAYLIKSGFVPDEPLVRVAVAEGSENIVRWNSELVGRQTYTSTWNFADGSKQQVAVFTNTQEVELIVNGRSLGRKANDNTAPGTQHIVTWQDVPYGRGGSIVAVGYDGGKEVARHTVQTAGKATALKVEVETPHGWKADGMDLQYLKVYAVDSRGRVVPGFGQKASFQVEGAATLLAVDNGDHYTDELFLGVPAKDMKGGFVQAILRSGRAAGPVTVTITAGNLKKTVTLATEP
ncbi:MAG: DUF4982 domain-containing protein [Bacteroidales bacterium]|nr:DUF4982 domain-containing protein [Bacteroidales bacterium]